MSDESQLKSVDEEEPMDISFDVILKEIGEFGRYQILSGILTSIVILLSSFALFNFVFSAAIPDHRCLIPECETSSNASFTPDWLEHAVPYKEDQPEKCLRFSSTTESEDYWNLSKDYCTSSLFNHSNVIACSEIITKNHERRLSSQLNIFCTGYEYQLAFVGTANTIGRLAVMPVLGLISDRFGRLTIIVGSSVLSAIFGVGQAFSQSYVAYIIMEFLVAAANAGILTTVFIYSTEWVTSKHRVTLLSFNGVGTSFGSVIIGIVAMYCEQDFRTFRLVLAVPSIICVLFYFILQESPRWLLARCEYPRAIKKIQKAAKMNGTMLSDNTIRLIETKPVRKVEATTTCVNTWSASTLWQILRHKRLAIRLIVLSLVWICSIFSYYGVVLASTQIHENKYMSFMIVAAAEVPGIIIAFLILDRFGRRMTNGGTLFVCGASIIAASFIPMSQWHVRIILFIIGKAAVTATFLTLYMYTAELWPTTVRNTVTNICSMFGRTGAIMSSLTVLLNEDYPYLPSLLCGLMATFGAILTFIFLPETLNRKLPDTIDEALEIGTKKD